LGGRDASLLADRNRALLIRCSTKDDSHLALLQFAYGLIAFKESTRCAARTHPIGMGPL
jgi:hypothetical protein